METLPQEFQFDNIQAFKLPEQDKLIEKKIPSFNFGNNNKNNEKSNLSESNNSSNFNSSKDFIIDLKPENPNKIEMEFDEITTSKEPISFKSKPKQEKLPPKQIYNIRRAIIRKKKPDE